MGKSAVSMNLLCTCAHAVWAGTLAQGTVWVDGRRCLGGGRVSGMEAGLPTGDFGGDNIGSQKLGSRGRGIGIIATHTNSSQICGVTEGLHACKNMRRCHHR